MAQDSDSILYLALADARGHLMRAHLVRELLALSGVGVDIVTTSFEGQRFLAELGTPSEVLSEHFRVAFGEAHDMDRSRTDACVLSYVLRPGRGARDLLWLERRALTAPFVVCDSLHPALLAAPLLGRPMKVVHVAGENLWQTATDNFEGRAPAWARRAFSSLVAKMGERAFGRITHTLGDRVTSSDPEARRYVLPPLVAPALRTPAAVRQSLGLSSRDRLAVVYLNPHFHDPRIAKALESAAAAEGFRLYAVGEGYASRDGWRTTDPRLMDVVRAADVFVSGAGMGALAQSRLTGTPLIALMGDQPEQQKNAAFMAARGEAAFHAIPLASDSLPLALRLAFAGASVAPRGPDRTADIARVQSLWTQVFTELLDLTRKETSDENRRTHPRDEQPSRWQGRKEPRRGGARAPLRAPRAPVAPALGARGDHRHA